MKYKKIEIKSKKKEEHKKEQAKLLVLSLVNPKKFKQAMVCNGKSCKIVGEIRQSYS